jgi:hypothetical protein
MAVTINYVVIHQATGLHEGIDNGGANKTEAALFHILRNLLGQRRHGRHILHAAQFILQWFAIHKIPKICGKIRHGQIGLRIADAALSSGGCEQCLYHSSMPFLPVCNAPFFRVEVIEGLAKCLALAQNCDPREPRLKTIKLQFFKQRPGIIFRHAPFHVVIGHINRISAAPRAAANPIFMQSWRH